MPLGSELGQEIELCSNLQNVSFLSDRKVHVYNISCTISVSLDEPHLCDN